MLVTTGTVVVPILLTTLIFVMPAATVCSPATTVAVVTTPLEQNTMGTNVKVLINPPPAAAVTKFNAGVVLTAVTSVAPVVRYELTRKWSCAVAKVISWVLTFVTSVTGPDLAVTLPTADGVNVNSVDSPAPASVTMFVAGLVTKNASVDVTNMMMVDCTPVT